MSENAERNPRFLRLLQIVRALSARRMGMTAAELARLTGVSRASVYRDLESLEKSGYHLDRRESRTETRICLLKDVVDGALPGNAPALDARLAYEALRALYFAPLQGLDVVDALDAHFRRVNLRAPRPSEVGREPDAGVVEMRRALGKAIAEGRRVRLTTRDPRARADVTVECDPKGWRLVKGAPYLLVYLPDAKATRLIKGRRIQEVVRLPAAQDDVAIGSAALGPAADAAYDSAFVAVVRFPARFGELLGEYPLNGDQAVGAAPGDDDRLEVRVPCTNLMGAVRWVLGWGADAEAVGPAELRAAVAREALGMAGWYRGR